MELALRLGRRALGTTAENPNVGCVIVRDGRLVGAGGQALAKLCAATVRAPGRLTSGTGIMVTLMQALLQIHLAVQVLANKRLNLGDSCNADGETLLRLFGSHQ